MEKAQEKNNHGPAEEESPPYLWLAGAFVGGFLILTIIIIIGIIVWRYFKKQNTSMYDNWARPPPLADGNILEGVNSSILGRSMSVSHMSISPIISNEHLAIQEENEIDKEHQFGNFTGEDVNKEKLTTNTPIVPVAPTKYASPASKDQMSTQITDNGLKEETFPPPLEEYPVPPQPEQEQNLQPVSEGISYQQDGNGIQEPIHLQISHTDIFHNNNLEDQLLPPPPPDF